MKKTIFALFLFFSIFNFLACFDKKTNVTSQNNEFSSKEYIGQTGVTDENITRSKNETWLFMNEQ